MKTSTPTDAATPRPWKAPELWDSSGMVKNSIHQDCQPGCKYKSDTTAICYFPEDMKINRPNAELIVRAVNLLEHYEKLEKATTQLLMRVNSEGGRFPKSEKEKRDQFIYEANQCLANLQLAKLKEANK